MVIRYGSSDFTLFSVHSGAAGFRTIGPTPGNTRHLEHRIEKGNAAALMRSEADGAIWGWRYEVAEESPRIWVVRKVSTGAVFYAHEAESRIDESDISPLTSQQIGRNGTAQSILPAGSEITEALIPLGSVITDIETEIEEGDIPDWVAGTTWEWATDPAVLLNYLFQAEQQARELPVMIDIATVYTTDMAIDRTALYTLLWLRCASSILYNHADRHTCIPLIKGHFLVDTNGVVII